MINNVVAYDCVCIGFSRFLGVLYCYFGLLGLVVQDDILGAKTFCVCVLIVYLL